MRTERYLVNLEKPMASRASVKSGSVEVMAVIKKAPRVRGFVYSIPIKILEIPDGGVLFMSTTGK